MDVAQTMDGAQTRIGRKIPIKIITTLKCIVLWKTYQKKLFILKTEKNLSYYYVI